MREPNILLITSDQQHYMTLGINNPDIKTPNLDRLASMGMVSDRTYCPNPTCTPTRASIITGQYPSGHGAWTLGTKLDENVVTLGELLETKNYKSTLVGKAHFQPVKETSKYSSIESYPTLHDLEFWKEKKHDFYGFDNIELIRNHTIEWLVGQHYVLWLEEKGFKNWKDYYLEPAGNMKYSDFPDPIDVINNNEGKIKEAKRQWGKWDIPVEAHYNTWISERTCHYLEEHKKSSEPFFIWASFPDPHPDYFVPEPYASMYDPNKLNLQFKQSGEISNPIIEKTQELEPDFTEYKESKFAIHGFHSHVQDEKSLRQDVAWYYGMVTFMDLHIGRILDKLDELGLTDNTLVVFTTDHGHYYGQHGLIRKGAFHYEDAIKIPFIASYPKYIKCGSHSTSMNTLVDFTPTVLDMVGIDKPCFMSGISQKDVWFGTKDSVRDHIICEHHHEENTINMRTYVGERYKITVYQGKKFGDLFDLEEDPNELINLWNDPKYKDLKMELLQCYIDAELNKEKIMMPRIANA